MTQLWHTLTAFYDGLRRKPSSLCGKEAALRESLTERQIDKMIADSFPASDPPSVY